MIKILRTEKIDQPVTFIMEDINIIIQIIKYARYYFANMSYYNIIDVSNEYIMIPCVLYLVVIKAELSIVFKRMI